MIPEGYRGPALTVAHGEKVTVHRWDDEENVLVIGDNQPQHAGDDPVFNIWMHPSELEIDPDSEQDGYGPL